MALRWLGGLLGPDPNQILIASEVAIVGGLGLGVYLGLAAVLRIPELPSTIEVMRDIVLRRRST